MSRSLSIKGPESESEHRLYIAPAFMAGFSDTEISLPSYTSGIMIISLIHNFNFVSGSDE